MVQREDPDPNLKPENIKCGVTIYGVMGEYGRHFRDNGDGTVTDNITGLMWTKNANHGLMNWNSAIRYCRNLHFAGYDNWHMPTIAELKTLIDNRFTDPALSNACGTGKWTPGDAFTGVQSSYYWSSTYPPYTIYVNLYSGAYYLNLYSGNVSQAIAERSNENYYVWPVRGGR